MVDIVNLEVQDTPLTIDNKLILVNTAKAKGIEFLVNFLMLILVLTLVWICHHPQLKQA